MLELILYGLYGLLTATTIYIIAKLMKAINSFELRGNTTSHATTKDQPSVSVCIPARNEMHAMTDCLDKVIACDYPKLEIIVLDDNSADKTSVLIKSFAHAGVRFIEGESLPEGWLGKNNALEGLLQEASGKYILFMSVDTRLSPTSISQLVSYMEDKKVEMVSVMPMRLDGWRMSVIMSTLRYFWVLTTHNKAHPAVSSGIWMISRKKLEEMGGFREYALAIQPEMKIAAELSTNDSYHFLLSNQQLGIGFEKKWLSQVETHIRLFHSMFGSDPLSSARTLLKVIVLNVPLVVMLTSFSWGWTLVHWIALWQTMVFMAIYGVYTGIAWRKGWWLGALLWPLTIFQELVVVIISIYKNIRHHIVWKGRSITLHQD